MGIPIYFGTKLYGWVDNGDGTSDATMFFHVYYVPIFPTGSYQVVRSEMGAPLGAPRSLRLKSVASVYMRSWGILAAVLLALAAHDSLRRGPLVNMVTGALLAGMALAATLGVAFAWLWMGRQRGAPWTGGRIAAAVALLGLAPIAIGWHCVSGVIERARHGLTSPDNARDLLSLALAAQAKNDREQAQRLTTECATGDGGACNRLAYRYQKGEGVPRDQRRAAETYAKACDAKVAGGCLSAAELYDKSDPARATALLVRGCDLGSAVACNNAAVQFEAGLGVAVDGKRAAELYRLGCDAGSGKACNNLGLLYAAGKLVPKSRGEASAAFQRGCAAGYVNACANRTARHPKR